HNPHHLDLPGAASYLSLDEGSVRALVGSGYLRPVDASGEPTFAIADLKAFLARNADNGSGNLLADEEDAGDPQVLLEALDGRSDEMARRAFDIFAAAFPETRSWSLSEQARFVEQARNRFEAILAVTGQGSAVDEALVGDLQDVGAAAAWAGSPLPHLLAILRISRDLVVQTAVELAEQRGRHWGLALSLLLTRVLPAMDRLTDAIAQGYWAAQVGREEEMRDRYQHVVETSSNGVFEVDLDGRLQYANTSLGVILGRRPEELDGAPLQEVIRPVDPNQSVEPLMSGAPGETEQHRLVIRRPDGVRRVVEVRTTARYRFEELVGYQGVVEDLTAALDLEADKNEFLALVTRDLRAPLTTLLAQGANLEANAGELPSDQVSRMGGAIRNQAERIARLADDLYDVSRMESSQLVLSPRTVDLARVVHSALASVPAPRDVDVRIPFGVEVLADPRRLEQVVANLVENGLFHGAPPVVVGLEQAADGKVEWSITDQGPGVDVALRATLFSGIRSRPGRPGARPGLGLGLVKGLVEAMGGTVAYEAADVGARFVVTLPQPRRR
ncbi:MAG TPA: PAS domain-containing sensor histidine kinase, partial [Acidimicrobiales bacterium]